MSLAPFTLSPSPDQGGVAGEAQGPVRRAEVPAVVDVPAVGRGVVEVVHAVERDVDEGIWVGVGEGGPLLVVHLPRGVHTPAGVVQHLDSTYLYIEYLHIYFKNIYMSTSDISVHCKMPEEG